MTALLGESNQAIKQVWLNGPEFLYEEEDMWPNMPKKIKEMTDEDLEWRKGAQINEILANEQNRTMNDFLEYYSSWYRLQKGVAWLMRFLLFLNQQIRREREFTSGPLTVTEICVATKWIVRYLQQQHFPDIMKALRGNLASLKKAAVKRSQLNKLNPILVDGILRVGGCLEQGTISFNTKHPMILPQCHHVTDLIIQHYHRQEGHMGPTQVLATIRLMFCILLGPTEVRRVINNCVDCQKRHAKPGTQVMAPLPSVHITPVNPPSTFVGVDYFGPLMVRQGRSVVKRYGCLFTCLTMRAAYSLDAKSFLCAFSRFIAQRGQPKEVYSNNGTNFTATHSVPKKEFEKLQANSRSHLLKIVYENSISSGILIHQLPVIWEALWKD